MTQMNTDFSTMQGEKRLRTFGFLSRFLLSFTQISCIVRMKMISFAKNKLITKPFRIYTHASKNFSHARIAYNVKKVYTPFEDARVEITKRWKNNELKTAVEQYVSGIPACLSSEPRAVLFRNVASPTIEFELFLEQAKKINLKPLALEYTNDKFSTHNNEKLHLLKISTIIGHSKNSTPITTHQEIAQITANDTKRFSEITTYSGESLVDFHHKLMSAYGTDVFDMSEWIQNNGEIAKEYYKKFFALSLCHMVLFETFTGTRSEYEFAEKIVLPAYKYVKEKFGTAPLIVQNLSTPNNPYWLCHSENVFTDITPPTRDDAQ
jgi:hypothetical protein